MRVAMATVSPPSMHVVKAEQQLDEPIDDLDLWEAPPGSSHLLNLTVQIPILMGVIINHDSVQRHMN